MLWESFGTATAPEVGDLVSDVKFENGYISFKASNKKGNAVIAAKDAAGTILWSWHIWMTDQPVNQAYLNSAGTMMDRNLGATSVTPGDVKALGLLYQWGRKDQFLGASKTSFPQNEFQTQAASTNQIQWIPTPIEKTPETINFATQNPMTFVIGLSDWIYPADNTLWSGGAKTIYDPCPVGYRVPKGGEARQGGVWAKAFDATSGILFADYNASNKGFDFGKNATTKLTNADTCWYPLTGLLLYSAGASIFLVGSGSCCWTCSSRDVYAYVLVFKDDGIVSPSENSPRTYGNYF